MAVPFVLSALFFALASNAFGSVYLLLPENACITYTHADNDFSRAITNDDTQKSQIPSWDYSRYLPNNQKYAFSLNWEPILEPQADCNGLTGNQLKHFKFLVALDSTWTTYYTSNSDKFSVQGYNNLETSPNLMFDRVSYLFETQFDIKVSASRIVSLPNLQQVCASTNGTADDGSAEAGTAIQLAAAGYTVNSDEAGIVRFGIGPYFDNGNTYCNSYADGEICQTGNLFVNIWQPFSDSGELDKEVSQTLAHELAHAFGVCDNDGNTVINHCENNHMTNEIPDIMVWEPGLAVGARPEGMFYTFFTACPFLYRDTVCNRAQNAPTTCYSVETNSMTLTLTPTPSPWSAIKSSATPTSTPSNLPSAQISPSPTSSATTTPTPTAIPTVSPTATATCSVTPSMTLTPSVTPTPSTGLLGSLGIAVPTQFGFLSSIPGNSSPENIVAKVLPKF